ncbi:MAG: hypothetical protein J5523_06925 [Muribaculaceae bacterium]|nr:hypothetical protein [Muribaculaceae bacterium]
MKIFFAKTFAYENFDINLHRFSINTKKIYCFIIFLKITKMKKLVLLFAVVASVAMFSCKKDAQTSASASASASTSVSVAPEASTSASVAPEASASVKPEASASVAPEASASVKPEEEKK